MPVLQLTHRITLLNYDVHAAVYMAGRVYIHADNELLVYDGEVRPTPFNDVSRLRSLSEDELAVSHRYSDITHIIGPEGVRRAYRIADGDITLMQLDDKLGLCHERHECFSLFDSRPDRGAVVLPGWRPDDDVLPDDFVSLYPSLMRLGRLLPASECDVSTDSDTELTEQPMQVGLPPASECDVSTDSDTELTEQPMQVGLPPATCDKMNGWWLVHRAQFELSDVAAPFRELAPQPTTHDMYYNPWGRAHSVLVGLDGFQPQYVPAEVGTDVIKADNRLIRTCGSNITVSRVDGSRSISIDGESLRLNIKSGYTPFGEGSLIRATFRPDMSIHVIDGRIAGTTIVDIHRPVWQPDEHWLQPQSRRRQIKALFSLRCHSPVSQLPRDLLLEIARFVAS